MSLLAILISLALEKFLPTLNGLRNLNWIAHYQQWVHARLAKHPKWIGLPSLLIIILLPVIGTAAVQYYLNDLLALFSFLFSVVVLTYCLGPKDEHRRVNNYLNTIEDENRTDKDNLQTELSEILQAGGVAGDPSAMDDETRINRLIYAVLTITHERILAILFWFVVLGPMGAVLYRLTLALLLNRELNKEPNKEPNRELDSEQNKQPLNNLQHASQAAGDDNAVIQIEDSDNFNEAVKRLHHLLGWIPSHLSALSYAVMGSFAHALHAWHDRRKKDATANPDKDQMERRNTFDNTTTTESPNRDLLLRIGIAALQFNNNSPKDNNAVRETLGLCGRSLVAWITILAIMTLAGWAS